MKGNLNENPTYGINSKIQLNPTKSNQTIWQNMWGNFKGTFIYVACIVRISLSEISDEVYCYRSGCKNVGRLLNSTMEITKFLWLREFLEQN